MCSRILHSLLDQALKANRAAVFDDEIRRKERELEASEQALVAACAQAKGLERKYQASQRAADQLHNAALAPEYKLLYEKQQAEADELKEKYIKLKADIEISRAKRR